MHFITLVAKNLLRRRVRSLLTVVGLSTAVAAVVALVGISDSFVGSFHQVYEAHGVDLVVSRHGAADRLSSAMEESLAGQIAGLDLVAEASGVLLETLSLEDRGVYALPAMGLPPDSFLLQDFEILAGEPWDAPPSSEPFIRADPTPQVKPAGQPGPPGQVESPDRAAAPEPNGTDAAPPLPPLWVGEQLAARLEVTAGDSLLFFDDERFRVAGIFRSASVWESGSLALPLDDLQRLTGRPGQITFVNVRIGGTRTPDEVERAAESIEERFERLSALPTRQFVESDTRMRLASAMAWMTSSIALLIGGVGVFNTMSTSVYERTREIGVLRAIGWRRSRVARMVMTESLLLSGSAAAVGIALGVGLVRQVSRQPAVAGVLVPHVGPTVMGQAVALALGIGLLGASLPTWRAIRIPPAEALRHE